MAIKRIPDIQDALDFIEGAGDPNLMVNTIGDLSDIAFNMEAENPEQAEFWAAFGGKLQDMEIELREIMDEFDEESPEENA